MTSASDGSIDAEHGNRVPNEVHQDAPYKELPGSVRYADQGMNHQAEAQRVDRTELAKRIKDAAYLEGDFTLRSGKKSKYYLDKYLFETQPDILVALGQMFAKHVTVCRRKIGRHCWSSSWMGGFV